MQQNGKQQRSRIQMQSLKIYWSWLWQLNLWWKTSITLKPEGKMNVSVGIYSRMYMLQGMGGNMRKIFENRQVE